MNAAATMIEALVTRVLPRLCVCADDFGLHPAVNEAVLRLAAQGRLHATSAMVGAPAWQAGATDLSRLDATDIDVGLHLDLTEYPLTVPAKGLGWWLLHGPRRVPALHREVHAQLDAFEQTLGRMPAFVDGHQHVHQFPGVRDALLTVLADRYPAHHPWLRSTRHGGRGFKPWVINTLGRRGLERDAAALDFAFNRRLLGVYDFRGNTTDYQRHLQGWLAAARDGDLLMCHPATALVPGDAIAAARCQEFLVWSAGELDAWLSHHTLQLAPMSRTLKRPPPLWDTAPALLLGH
ncbi:ChbG/HpnK family deacetylase [Roseateles sp. SL47]|uniref:ChbG/HpnK family deacetylase n=1 Tax=Roseateles sp. SL47 TaxID=2995138 RepID=UPI002271447D|nr:ChbG/HpnK family deacetylase [Roseateles sp. SL47]WAC74809.1 ChbG/HpnK family deacetylase [Roseateles sp. SL47]